MITDKPHFSFSPVGEPIVIANFKHNKESFIDMHNNFLSFNKRHKSRTDIIGVVILAISIILILFFKTVNVEKLGISSSVVNPIVAISFILAFFGSIIFGAFLVGKLNYANKTKEQSETLNFSGPFEYKFYKEGIYENSPIQKGAFRWSDFSIIIINSCYLKLMFRPHYGVKGISWTKNYSVITIPVSHVSNIDFLLDLLSDVKDAPIMFEKV